VALIAGASPSYVSDVLKQSEVIHE